MKWLDINVEKETHTHTRRSPLIFIYVTDQYGLIPNVSATIGIWLEFMF